MSSYRGWEEEYSQRQSNRAISALESSSRTTGLFGESVPRRAAEKSSLSAVASSAPASSVAASARDVALAPSSRVVEASSREASGVKALSAPAPVRSEPPRSEPPRSEPTTRSKPVAIVFLTGNGRKVANILARANVNKVLSFEPNSKTHRTKVVTRNEEDAEKIIDLLLSVQRADYVYIEDELESDDEEEFEPTS